jgi:hypothetical protein
MIHMLVFKGCYITVFSGYGTVNLLIDETNSNGKNAYTNYCFSTFIGLKEILPGIHFRIVDCVIEVRVYVPIEYGGFYHCVSLVSVVSLWW